MQKTEEKLKDLAAVASKTPLRYYFGIWSRRRKTTTKQRRPQQHMRKDKQIQGKSGGSRSIFDNLL
jgi:hypothetical protein